MSTSELIQQLINALSLGSIYALFALGLAMVYSTLGILNFAYGELITIVGYTMTMPGPDAVNNKVYIGKDGLLYAQSGPNTKVRYRYQGVAAPKL